jgi:hypothetical protein
MERATSGKFPVKVRPAGGPEIKAFETTYGVKSVKGAEWMEIAREPRRKVMIRAMMRADGPRTDVCVRDISSRGLMIQASAPPPRGTYVDIDCAGHQIVGIVVWHRGHRFGVNSCERIDVPALARQLPPGIASPRYGNGTGRGGAARALPQSRAWGGRMEFAIVALLAAFLVGALGITAFQTLSRPFAAVSAVLGG